MQSIDKNLLEKLYCFDKLSAIKIAEIVDLKPHQVYYLLEKHGINRRSFEKMNTQNKVNENFFSKIDTEQKSYRLGFLYADGFVTAQHKVGITLCAKDILHIEKFRKDIEASHNIHIYEGQGYEGTKASARILISSKKLVSDLKNLGCIEHKSLVLKFPSIEQVPEKYQLDFIRGYLDGDGSITSGGKNHPLRLKFCGTWEFLEGVRAVLNTVIFPDEIVAKLEKRKKDNKNNYAITIGSTKRVLKILNALYSDATVFLDRKYCLYKKAEAKAQSSLSEMVGVRPFELSGTE